ncbi:FtsW/RodA/SpoVE family cell cycle protein [Rhodopila sp.]|uniref:FtsW/RodA/SpoVE family cell cycle protein n=1 Tax=Rhodopila sp. TaxID=2480087 RepID=UPI003D0E33B5
MSSLSRADDSVLGRWWWSIDRWILGAIGVLIGFGYIMMLAASPAVAERIGTSRETFILKQVVFLAVALVIILLVSLMSPRDIKRLAIAGCLVALALTAATMVMGVEIKGARRWISLPGMTIQPSEFLKPCFAVVAAWLLSSARKSPRFPGRLLAFGVFVLILLLLKSQPDIGMLAVVTAVFLAQLYIDGLPLILVGAAIGMIGGGSVLAYTIFPHVRSRVTRFWDGTGDNYQVTTALEAFGNGGLLGRGPGEGHVKDVLPDAHADFVFAVAGEEFGMLICVIILSVFAFIVMRGLLRLLREQDPFIVLSCTGLVTGFGLQALVNMASTLHLIPTKGMTLPFISYGGSSVIAVALGMGMLLALTRRRSRDEPP